MKNKDLEAEVETLRAFIDEIQGLAKLARRYHDVGPGYVEEILDKIEALKNPEGGSA